MADEIKTKKNTQASRHTRPPMGRGGNRGNSGFSRGGSRGPRRATEREKPEYDQKIIDVRRVARVVSGGRRFSFSVALVAGNRKGKVGVGLGKASDTTLAIDKAMRDAKRTMLTLTLTKTMSIPHETAAKYCSARVLIKPAHGRGLVAGSSVRNVLALGGITDVNAKLLSKTKNKLNNARAAMEALRVFAA